MAELIVAPIMGLNTILPPHRMGEGECSVYQNFIPWNNMAESMPGTDRYNGTALEHPITWAERYYGILPDRKVKKLFCHSNGVIYVGNDATGALTEVGPGFTLGTDIRPESITMQVAGRSRMYFFNGMDLPEYYEGDDANTWEESAMKDGSGNPYAFVQGADWLQRLWAFVKDGSNLQYSKTLYPENFTDSTDAGLIPIGQSRDSYIVRLAILGDYLFIFKNDSIFYISGRTPTEFKVKQVTDKFGLAAKSAFCKVGSAIVFLNEMDKEWYSFGGNETSIKLLSKDVQFSKMADLTKVDNICCCEHKNLFRASFQHFEATGSSQYNSHEICYPTTEVKENGQPKWFTTKGANINCYSLWDKQDDENELVTGRSDTGLLMYHYRGNDWDDTPMELWIKARDVVPILNRNVTFNRFWIDAAPNQNKEIDFRWYLNGRLKGATYGEYGQLLDGETQNIGAISFNTTARFNDRITPLIKGAHGNSIAFELHAEVANLSVKLYSIVAEYTPAELLTTNLVG